MEEFTNWTEVFIESLKAFGAKIVGAIPSMIAAILILLLGWLFALFIGSAITRVLRILKFDELAEKINATTLLSKANIHKTPSKLIGKFVYWIIMLLILITATDVLGWQSVSQEISKLLTYLPKLLMAVVFFIVGYYIAVVVRDVIYGTTSTLGMSSGKILSNIVFYILMILIVLTALDQGGIDIAILKSNLLIILGAIFGAAAISYGLASRDVLTNILASHFNRQTFYIGQVVEVDGQKGVIIKTTNQAFTLEDDSGRHIVIPAQVFLNQKIIIHNEKA